MTDGAAPDALAVVHRLTDPDRLARCCRAAGCQRVLVVSTHGPFAHERAGLAARLAPSQVGFATFAGLVDDAAAAAIDDETTRDLLARREPAAGYIHAFQTEMRRRKNAAVHARVRQAGEPRHLFADTGLGIDGDYWRGQGAVSLAGFDPAAWFEDHPWRLAAFHWWHGRRRPRHGTWVEAADGTHLFAGTLKRLPLRPGTAATTVPFTRARAAAAAFVATTVHDHWPAERVFADGYLPSNYPRTYLDSFGPAEFVATDPFSAGWLRRHGRTVAPVPSFLAPAAWTAPAAPPAFRTVVGLLNHTGDWSALVNRSDTDALAGSFLELAREHPGLDFRLRPHPGMDARRHEGRGGVARLADLVAQARLPNLTCSTGPLAADLEAGDLFVSEYSATLLDAWRRGKAGVIANLTGRRSFMEDFARLGFTQVSSAAGLSAALEHIRRDPAAFHAAQAAAVGRYNHLLAGFLAR